MKQITLTEVEYLAFRLAKETMSFDEPIPDFSTRFPNILESCLAVPFQRIYQKSLYKGLIAKAAMLFYLMVKNHPFQNGNKRIAMTVLTVFLYKNGRWLKIGNRELYNFAVWVTESPADLKDETTKAIEKFLKNHLINLK